MSRVIMNIALFVIKILYLLLRSIAGLVGETKGHIILVKFLSTFISPFWYFTPNLFGLTSTFLVDQNLMTFRPLVLSDLVMVTTDWEPYVKSIFQPRPGEIVIDVGAHIGFYTLKAAREVGPEGTVIAIEPDLRNFLLLKRNVAINRFNNVITLNVALSDTNGQKSFYASIDPLYSSFYFPSHVRHTKKVEVVTLDKLLQDLGIDKVDWIKVDVEGAELMVLGGGERILRTTSNLKIIIETSDHKTLDYLAKLGFQIEKLIAPYYFAFRKR